jgi:hypothetical protein
MQTVIQIVSSRTDSLRERIVNDADLGQYGLRVETEKKKGRTHGWAKLYGDAAQGALNLQWLAAPRALLGRIVTKGDSCPALLAGTFLRYVLARYREEIKAIHIWTQEGSEDTAGDA